MNNLILNCFKSGAGSFISKFIPAIFLILTFINCSFSQKVDSKLSELRTGFANNYLEPEAHFDLAEYYLDKGDRIQAFYILEYARRYIFPQPEFNAAFKDCFGKGDSEPNAEAKQAFDKAYEFLKQKDLEKAEISFIVAANLAPKSAFIQSWVGRFFVKAKPDNEKALKHYLNAYLLAPDAYDTEYAEYRIRNLVASEAEIRFNEMLKSKKPLSEILADTNPIIAGLAIDEADKHWKKEYLSGLLQSLNNDENVVRQKAFVTIFKNEKESTKKVFTALLNDKDARKRGLTAYFLKQFEPEKFFDILQQMLNDKAQLIRFDAVSVLMTQGGEKGIEILKKHRITEQNRTLQIIIDKYLSKKADEL